MRDNVFAYTAAGCNYPEFISVNSEEAHTIEITVRSPAKEDGSCGETATIKLDAQASLSLSMRLSALLNVRG